jgi:hypothetical protein
MLFFLFVFLKDVETCILYFINMKTILCEDISWDGAGDQTHDCPILRGYIPQFPSRRYKY